MSGVQEQYLSEREREIASLRCVDHTCEQCKDITELLATVSQLREALIEISQIYGESQMPTVRAIARKAALQGA